VELVQAIDEHRKCAAKSGETPQNAVQIMEAYAAHRRSVAAQVIDMVEGMTEMETGGGGWGPYFRITALWAVFKVPFVNGMIAWRLSGLGHAKQT
jgi:hypothetical protein